MLPVRRLPARALRSLGLALAVAPLITAPSARAGGDFLDLAAGSSRVWVVGAAGVNALDARTGRTLARPALVRTPYSLSVALAGGAAWIASVENGYVWGTLSRIDTRTGTTRVLWRRRESSVQYVAAGAGGVYALIASKHGTRVARFALDGRLERFWQVPGAGRIAADDSGCWITAAGSLFHIDQAGLLHRILSARLGSIAVGEGASGFPVRRQSSAWTSAPARRAGSAPAVSPSVASSTTSPCAATLSGFWCTRPAASPRRRCSAWTPPLGRITGRVAVPGIANAVVVATGAVWVATAMAPAGAVATGYAALRFDPRTLRRALIAQVG